MVCICTTAITWGFIVLGRLWFMFYSDDDEESSEAQEGDERRTSWMEGEAQ